MPRATASSGNVFKDIGISNPEEHLIKAQLAAFIGRLIKEQNLTQAEAAQRMGLKQPDVSNVLRGRFSGYSIERMLMMAVALGADVSISVKKPTAKASRKSTKQRSLYPKLEVA